MYRLSHIILTGAFIIIGFGVFGVSMVFGQESDGPNFVELVGIPYFGTDNGGGEGLGGYVNSLYLVAISIAAILAVLKIVISGVRYMLSEIVTDKGQAKKDIKNALLGLLVVIGAFLILNTINPNLTQLNILNLAPLTAELRQYQIEGGEPERSKVEDIAKNKADCEATDGNVHRAINIGTASSPNWQQECCIGGQCQNLTVTDTEIAPGTTINNGATYSLEEYNQIIEGVRSNGTHLFNNDISFGEEERQKKICSSRSGNPYIVQRERAASAPQLYIICVKR